MLHAYMEELSAKERLFLHLRFYEGMDFHEISGRFNISLKITNLYYQNILKKLRDKFYSKKELIV